MRLSAPELNKYSPFCPPNEILVTPHIPLLELSCAFSYNWINLFIRTSINLIVLSFEQDAIIDPEGWNFTQVTELFNDYVYILIYISINYC